MNAALSATNLLWTPIHTRIDWNLGDYWLSSTLTSGDTWVYCHVTGFWVTNKAGLGFDVRIYTTGYKIHKSLTHCHLLPTGHSTGTVLTSKWTVSPSPSPSPSPSHIVTDGQSVCLSWCRAPAGAHDQIFSFFFSYMKVAVLFIWGALSEERSGLSFVSHSPY
jgi:hypothetical protein